MLDSADVILIERQPQCGLVHVEQLLYSRYRTKSRLCSPTTLHKWLGIRTLDYEARKVETTRRAAPYLDYMAHFRDDDRKHDMADAMCFIMWYVDQLYNKRQIQLRQEENQRTLHTRLDGGSTIGAWLDTFRHASGCTGTNPLRVDAPRN